MQGAGTLLHPGSILPIKDVRSLVLCSSVYSPTGWVSRRLTVSELGRSCDLQDSIIKGFPDQPLPEVPLSTKNDDAEIPVEYWDNLVWAPWATDDELITKVAQYVERYRHPPLTSIRRFAFLYWQ